MIMFLVKRLKASRGFTLIELLAVLVILSIILLIAVPTISSSVEKAEAEVCNANVVELERAYEMRLALDGAEHEELLFTQFVREFDEETCPGEGLISYKDGDVVCSEHSDGDHEEDEEDADVPFL